MNADLFTQALDLSATTPAELWALGRQFHEDCEAFDRTVCTGGTARDGAVLPADHLELELINRHARACLDGLADQARAAGYSRGELLRVIRKTA